MITKVDTDTDTDTDMDMTTIKKMSTPTTLMMIKKITKNLCTN